MQREQDSEPDRGRWVLRLLSLALFVVALVERLDARPSGDSYFDLPLSALEYEPGDAPEPARCRVSFHQPRRALDAFVRMEGAGEAYLVYPTSKLRPEVLAGDVRLALRAPEGAAMCGTLWLPTADDRGWSAHRFEVDAASAYPAARSAWWSGRFQRYSALVERGLPGAGWFRHQREQARAQLAELSAELPPEFWSVQTEVPRRSAAEEIYELLSGGRALSESLQLDRLLEPSEERGAWTAIGELSGVVVPGVDWSGLVQGLDPELDPLAGYVPADQHALFLPRFQALGQLLQEVATYGAPVLPLLGSTALPVRTIEGYERQLCVSMEDLEQACEEHGGRSVVVTGSDPYLGAGTDLAILIETTEPARLLASLVAAQREAGSRGGAALTESSDGGSLVHGAESGDWGVSSFAARFGDAVALANTRGQLERISRAATGELRSLEQLEEYVFFRDRYDRAEPETAFLMISDATLRRWCSPKWRIGAARRARAAAHMLDLKCAHLAELISGEWVPRELDAELLVPEGGTLRLTERGVASSVYGSPAFLTPISELELVRVTPGEAREYRRFRNLYQSRWSRYLDPVAARFVLEAERVELDLSVMPLIDASEYQEWAELTRGVSLEPDAGEPHPEALVHGILAVQPDSRALEDIRRLASYAFLDLDWVGEHVEFWADRDPCWAELSPSEPATELPLAVRVACRDSARLEAVLSRLRRITAGGAAGFLQWETREHRGQHYEVLRPGELLQDMDPSELEALALQVQEYVSSASDAWGQWGRLYRFAAKLPARVFLHSTEDALLVSFSEALVQGAIDRRLARDAGQDSRIEADWLGESVALRVEGDALPLALARFGEDLRRRMQRLSWEALPILDEWRRLSPEEDPVAFHERHFHHRLVDPGGGAFVSVVGEGAMCSSTFGCPSGPRGELALPRALGQVTRFEAGASLGPNGLRARVVLTRRAD